MNKLSSDLQSRVVAGLIEGNNIRAIVRQTGVAKNTISKLLVNLGKACSEYQDKAFRNLTCKRVQCDEILSFVYAKNKNLPNVLTNQDGVGSVWTWVAIDPDTKLVLCWFVGNRDAIAAYHFTHDLAGRLANRVQITTVGHKPYLPAVENAFGKGIGFARLMKGYGNEQPDEELRYSPAQCIPAITAKPHHNHFPASQTEPQNLTLRLTNAISKKIKNHEAAIALHYMHYNYVRIHQTLRATPAMEAGISNHVWTIGELVSLIR